MRSEDDNLRAYEREAVRWDRARDRSLFEKAWLDRFLDLAPPGAEILDLGCGGGEPVAAYLLRRGCRVTGVDFSGAMLALARARFPGPGAEWIEADIRALRLGRRFGGVLSWDGFFHLTRDEQRAALPRIVRHLAPGGALLLTVGPAEGEASGRVCGSEVHHASLSAAEYRDRLAAEDVTVETFMAGDPECGGHSVLLARRRPETT